MLTTRFLTPEKLPRLLVAGSQILWRSGWHWRAQRETGRPTLASSVTDFYSKTRHPAKKSSFVEPPTEAEKGDIFGCVPSSAFRFEFQCWR
jgi:hypothetical protein